MFYIGRPLSLHWHRELLCMVTCIYVLEESKLSFIDYTGMIYVTLKLLSLQWIDDETEGRFHNNNLGSMLMPG